MYNITPLVRKNALFSAFPRRFTAFLFVFIAFSSLLEGQDGTNFFLKFPDDRIVTDCDGTGIYGSVKYFAPIDSFVGISFRDDTFWVVPDACFSIERTWKVINWYHYDSTCTFQRIPNPAPNALADHPDNQPGPIVSGRCMATAGDVWNATQVKLTPNDSTATNFCTFWKGSVSCSGGPPKFNGYIYTQIIKVIDTQAPEVRCLVPNGNDLTDNDAQFWNTPDWWDSRHGQQDLAEMPINLGIVASDLCTGPNNNIRYLLFLDLDANGTMETVIDSEQPQQPNTVFFDNAQFPNYIGGIARAFDQRPLSDPALDAYRFAVERRHAFGKDSAFVGFNTARTPGRYVSPQIPHGRHKIKWIIADRCGNETACEQFFEVKDAKKPTVVCKALTVNIMPDGKVQLWASDFLQHASDNCTPEDQLKFAVSTGDPSPNQFPRDANGNPITSVDFTCANLGPNIVQLWAEDKAGNADYCQVVLLVQDNMNICGVKYPIFGNVKTEIGKGIPGVCVATYSHPAIHWSVLTDSLGRFSLNNAVPINIFDPICPVFDKDHLNGVNALDMALIGKHILAIKPLDTPYKMISADANKSGTITTLDIVEIRNLILGKITKFSNSSWKFFDKNFVFPNPVNPFGGPFGQSNPTCVKITIPQIDSIEFIGTKVGDVDNSALPNMNMAPITRTAYLDVEDRAFQPGDEFSVAFATSELLAAQQFTLEHPGLDLIGIPSNSIAPLVPHFAPYDSIWQLAAAWYVGSTESERPAFTLRFRAKVSGTLSQFLKLSDHITQTAAFGPINMMTMSAERMHLVLRFKTVSSPEPGKEPERFTLYQNQPNPFGQNTAIGFYLPKPDRVILTVTDASGRNLHRQEGAFLQGYQQFTVDAAFVAPKGMLYYQVATSMGVESKKMTKQ